MEVPGSGRYEIGWLAYHLCVAFVVDDKITQLRPGYLPRKNLPA